MTLVSEPHAPPARRLVRVSGLVQGVGFRPFVWRLASELGIAGWVRNDARGVEIEVQGHTPELDRFLQRLSSEAPGLARIDRIYCREMGGVPGSRVGAFEIRASGGGMAATGIASDTAVCADCLGELFNPADRRYRYPFINCTQCGPRYTITRGLPYDRCNTSMARFELCTPCRAEYDQPAERRYHAQPNACPTCGPSLSLIDVRGRAAAEGDVLAAALARLRRGEILAVKGLGGFHLVCDARNWAAVSTLRLRKSREEKPLAVMVAGAASLAALALPSEADLALLGSRQRPVVLVRKHVACDRELPGVAPGIAWLGVMLPYTPLHYLLFHEAAGRPAGTDWLSRPQELVLVMTSANPGGEPLVKDNDEALQRLAGIADAWLLHDRDILVRCDDSVVRAGHAGTPRSAAFIRRARGYTPAPIRLARGGPSVLAVGGLFKNAVCVTRGDEAFLSQHIGDLDNAATCLSLEQVAAHLLDVLDVAPAVVAHDMHPDFRSTHFAQRYGAERGIAVRAIQHHHAHIESVVAEHGLSGAVLGVALDGVGLGVDYRAWGGELLRIEAGEFRRLGHLRELQLPGGDRAAREPWRMGASALHAMGRAEEIVRRYRHPGAATIAQMLEREIQAPLTSSAGRWFDAAAGLLGVREHCAYEGQAAMLLEGLAERHGPTGALQGGYRLAPDGVLDLLPLLAHLADVEDMAYGAALFHATLVQALAAWIGEAAAGTGISAVALGGGCFVNHVLSSGLRSTLTEQGLQVYEACIAPPNDGGLALGQAAVAMVQHVAECGA